MTVIPTPDARLLSAIPYIKQGGTVADIGTDHAYLPIYLVREGIVSRAIAADINRGPILSAQSNIETAGLSSRRRSDLRHGRGIDRADFRGGTVGQRSTDRSCSSTDVARRIFAQMAIGKRLFHSRRDLDRQRKILSDYLRTLRRSRGGLQRRGIAPRQAQYRDRTASV